MTDTTTYGSFTRTDEERRSLIEGGLLFRLVAKQLDGNLTVEQFVKACAATQEMRSAQSAYLPDVEGLTEDDPDHTTPNDVEVDYWAALARVVRVWDTDRPAAFRAATTAAILRRRLHQLRDELNEQVFPWTDSEAQEWARPIGLDEVPDLFEPRLPKDERPRARYEVQEIVARCLGRHGRPMPATEIAAETGLHPEELQRVRIDSYGASD